MALTKDDIQAIREIMRDELEPMKEQQQVHSRSIMTLENKVMHELKLLNENLPDVIARHEELNNLRETVDEHDNRIFALEQVANK